MIRSCQFDCFGRSYLLTFRMGFFLLCLFFICLFCWLGVWQLHRYHYKETLLLTHQQRLAATPQPFIPLVNASKEIDTLQFQSVTVEGHYRNSLTILIQNQFYHDQIGFEVLTPLEIPGQKKLLLIDRGWVKKPTDQILPSIDDVLGGQKITGYIKLMNEYQFILGQNISDVSAKPIIIQKIDMQELGQVMDQQFYPFILRLNPSQPHGFVRDWIVSTVLPQRHFGYAIQWFLMALVLFIAYICFCCERVNNEK